MNGLILVRKPLRVTSHDVVDALRRILGEKKIGHFGTLDPLASGLLLAAVGRVTRLFPFFSGMDKAYLGSIRLGFSTDTYDAAGRPTSPEAREFPTRESVEAALGQFEGEITQISPPFSAKKHHGTPLYIYARKNAPVEGRAFRVHIRSVRITGYHPPLLDVEVRCSSGTYIRTLAHDLGQKLACGAHLGGLVRTEIGGYKLEEAFSLEEIEGLREAGQTDRFLVPLEGLLPHLPRFCLDEQGLRLVKNGRAVPRDHLSGDSPGLVAGPKPGDQDPAVRLFSPSGRLVALARPSAGGDVLAPFLVFI